MIDVRAKKIRFIHAFEEKQLNFIFILRSSHMPCNGWINPIFFVFFKNDFSLRENVLIIYAAYVAPIYRV